MNPDIVAAIFNAEPHEVMSAMIEIADAAQTESAADLAAEVYSILGRFGIVIP